MSLGIKCILMPKIAQGLFGIAMPCSGTEITFFKNVINAEALVGSFYFVLWPVWDLIGSISMNSISFAERQRKWKEELDQELERERGKVLIIYALIIIPPNGYFHLWFFPTVMRLAGCAKSPSPSRGPNVKRERHADHWTDSSTRFFISSNKRQNNWW